MKKRFTALFITNFWGTLNDNFLKTLACFIAIQWVDVRYQSFVVSLAAGALVLPYIFCSPLAGRLTQLHTKKNVVRVAKVAELPIMALAVWGFAAQSIVLVVLALFLMGLQSSLYSPSKYGLVRDIGGMENVSNGMGGMEAISFFGMLAGTIVASVIVDLVPHEVCYVLLFTFALLGFISSLCLRANEERTEKKDRINPIAFLRETHRKAKAYPGLNPIIYTLSVFWWLAASMQIGLLIFCKQTMGLSSMNTGLLLSLAAVGISAGCILAGIIGKRHYQIGYVAFYGWIMAALLLVMFFVPMPPLPFAILLFCVAFVAGFFKVPLDAEIQRIVKGPLLNIILAYFNQVSFLFILGASITFALLTAVFPPKYLFLMLGLAFVIVPFYLMFHYRPLICFTVRTFLHLRYKVRITGMEHLNDEHTHLILPNHQAVMDPIILFAEFYNCHIRPLVDEIYFSYPPVQKILSNLLHAVCVPDLRKHRNGIEQVKQLHSIVIDALAKGEDVLFYPSGHITLDGEEHIGNRYLAYQVCSQLPSETVVLGIRTTGLWGSIWSRYQRNNTPPLFPTLLKSIGLVLCGYTLFHRRRMIEIHIEPVTEQIQQWSTENKQSFNQHLEEWYNHTNKE